MVEQRAAVLEVRRRHQRVIGRYGDRRAGPTMIAMAGIHGNEPSGVLACERVLERLRADQPPLRGELVAVTGNLEALRRGVRFVARDLNRAWAEDNVAAVVQGERSDAAEDAEQREVHAVLLETVLAATGEVYFVDLHTSSADGPPFVTIGDTLRNRRLAMSVPLPVILGLEEQVDGALLEYMNNSGHVTMGVEAGRHDQDSSVDHHEAVLWLTLTAAGMLDAARLPERERLEARLRKASEGTPRIVEVRHRHVVRPGDGFRMEPGFCNFTPVERGQVLAHDARGPIRAPSKGLVLLPLYQGQGDDGFFIAREVRPFWLGLSASLRHSRLDPWLRLLPGVRRHPSLVGTLVVNTRVARFYPIEFFHLFGYRKLRTVGVRLTVTRRRYDLQGPKKR